ncbi:MAG: hypothetical protein EP323_05515 [Gammaproteobacteria bacterium]|nr:MAG: hypothetical protein EP323_05515 [Gammaproteobacteria bacterium]
MNKQFNNISLALGIPGLILQIVGGLNELPVVTLIGGILLIAGLAYYAKSKNRLPAWGLLGLLSILGIVILGLLPDKSANSAARVSSWLTKLFLVVVLLLILAAVVAPILVGR